MANGSSSRGGVGFLTLLGLLFTALKLTGFIGWAWLVVLAPIWIQLAFIVVAFIVYVVADVMERREIERADSTERKDMADEASDFEPITSQEQLDGLPRQHRA